MKTKAIIFSTLAACLLFGISCKKESVPPTEYIVEGSVDSTMNGQMVYLLDYNLKRNIDSVLVDSGKFVFKGISDSVRYCRLNIENKYIDLILEGGNIAIDLEKGKASGTPLNETFRKFTQQTDSMHLLSFNTYEKLKEQEKDPVVLRRTLDSIYNKSWKPAYDKILDNTLEANGNNIIGMAVLNEMSYTSSTGKMDTAFTKLGKNILELANIQRLIKRNTTLKNTAEGQKFVDFSITQADGSTVSLSDYVGKGKYVLVDFWASWCGPCRGETPNLKELYSKYKGDNFEILGIAVWDKPEDSKKAIEEDKITWPQILDAKEIHNELYGINGIPHIMLIGPDGTILARNLRGDAMKIKVAETLGNK